MKKLLLILIILPLGMLGAFAQQAAQTDYAINGSVMRSELVKMDFQQQKAVFSTLSPEVCCKLWRTKLADCFHSDRLVDGEKAVLSFLYEYLSPAAYDSYQKEERARFQKMTETAESILQRYYDWAPSKVFRYLYTFMTEAEIDAYNETHSQKIR